MRGWKVIASFILRQRIPILVLVALATGFMWFNRSTERMHDFGKIIPQNDPDFIEYQEFRNEFGDDANALVLGLEGDILSREFFNAIYDLTERLKEVDGVKNVVSIANASRLTADFNEETFEIERVAIRPAVDDPEMDSLGKVISGLPFYRGLLFDDSLRTTLIAVTIDSKRLDTEEKTSIVEAIAVEAEVTAKKLDTRLHYSGLPYIRYYVQQFIPKEMYLFLGLAVAVMAIALFITFRSVTAVIFPMLVIGIVIVFALGIMGLLGYKITILTAVLPALIAVIGVPNSIYLLTKYHFEFKKSGNKIRALVNVIQKIGVVTVMTNATTAVGFGVLAFTQINMLKEFGILAGLSVVVTFFISLLLIPIIFSFLPAPSPRHIQHTDRKMLLGAIGFLNFVVIRRRWMVYLITIGLTGFAIYGMSLLRPRSLMVDDLPRDENVIADLEFFEDRFGGVMPFEIVVNTHRKQGILKRSTLKRLDEFQERMTRFPEVSRSISILDLIKFSRQALLSNVAEEYQLPSSEEFLAIQSFAKNSRNDSLFGQATIFDSTQSKARIKASVKDVGAARMAILIDSIQTDLEEIFLQNQKPGRLKEGESYRLYGTDSFRVAYKGVEYANGEVFAVEDTAKHYTIVGGEGKVDYADRIKITGTTKIFIKSNSFLISNLIQSLLIAFLVIAVLMALLFGSFKMVIIALLPNFLPLLLTAGVMGFAEIPLKPSTALIFSVAFGIAVDDTIHFLARFRYARKTGDRIIANAVSNSFKDTGVSMIYTSIILFFGFVIFAFSSYGGTEALGQLTSLTLLIALFTNLLLLPSLLISFKKDDEKVAEGWIDIEEKEDVEMIKEIIQGEDV